MDDGSKSIEGECSFVLYAWWTLWRAMVAAHRYEAPKNRGTRIIAVISDAMSSVR